MCIVMLLLSIFAGHERDDDERFNLSQKDWWTSPELPVSQDLWVTKQTLPGLKEDTNWKLNGNRPIYEVVQAQTPFKGQYIRLRMIPGLH